MSISNEQAMQELQLLKRNLDGAADITYAYRSGLLIGAAGSYWTTGIISYAQYQMMIDLTPEQVPA